LEHQIAIRIAIIGIEDLINRSGVQETADILAGHEMGDYVVHFAGWGDFSLAKRCFLPIGTDSMSERELTRPKQDRSRAG
jgi:hypothetical protein